MKESQKYLHFFKTNLLLFLILPLLTVGGMFWHLQNRAPLFEQQALYEVVYTQENIPNKIAETDQIVTLLRTSNLQNRLDLPAANITIYKPGPLAINIKTSSTGQEISLEALQKLTLYLEKNYQVQQIGGPVAQIIYPPYFSQLVISLGAGLFLALLVSLIKSYFKNF